MHKNALEFAIFKTKKIGGGVEKEPNSHP